MDKHTPGPRWTPWVAWAKHKNGVCDRLGRYAILQAGAGPRPIIADNIRTEADALCMAAAPELLEALESLVREVEGYFSAEELRLDRARAAIIKATKE